MYYDNIYSSQVPMYIYWV